jgi:hypothetical protein
MGKLKSSATAGINELKKGKKEETLEQEVLGITNNLLSFHYN